ncbi:MAG: hypothetical protein KI792_10610 [Alphaproteobacteria bacterium]|nr:hypothetical protein [Alphaproteobacteria bacterium SS10]
MLNAPIPDPASADSPASSRQADAADPLELAANLYRVTINRLAIEARTVNNPEYDDDVGVRLTKNDWDQAADSIAAHIDAVLNNGDQAAIEGAGHLLKVADPYNRPDLSDDSRDRWRQLEFAVEEARSGTGKTKPPATLLPLLEFYAGLVRIDRTVAHYYDATRYEKAINWSIGIGAVLLVMAVATAAANGFKDFNWGKVPKEGSLGVLCGFALGILLDIRRRHKTRQLVQEWGERFGCDLRDLRWRRLPCFVDRVRQELRRLGGDEYAEMDADTLEAAVDKLLIERGYHRTLATKP